MHTNFFILKSKHKYPVKRKETKEAFKRFTENITLRLTLLVVLKIICSLLSDVT